MEGALSNISYDAEKEKLNVNTDKVVEIINMRRKYPDYVDIVEQVYIIAEQLAEEEKRRKEEEREAKKEKRRMQAE